MDSKTIKIDELIDSASIGKLQWRVVVICFVLAVVDGFDLTSMSFVAPIVSNEFGLSEDVMGILMSSAMIGLVAGALIGSPMADRFGRKPVILFSITVMGLSSLLTATSSSTFELFLYRFLTGVGLGSLTPAINILTAEFAPKRRRAMLMTLMFMGLPTGTVLGAVIAASLIKVFSWESVFIFGGILPLLMAPIVLAFLPESPRFLALKGEQKAALSHLINRIVPDAHTTEQHEFEVLKAQTGSGIRGVFSGGLKRITLLLWLVFFTHFLTMIGLFNWMPYVLNSSGIPLDRSILASVAIGLGGIVGGLILATAIDRFNVARTMLIGFVAATVAFALIGQATGSFTLLAIILFAAGFTTVGCQFGLNAMASEIYDTAARATGLGYALAMGRVGAIIGPVIMGFALAMELPIQQLFILGALPLLVAATCVFVIGRLMTAKEPGH